MAGFQLKDFVSIAAAMINHARASQDRLTDFEVGAVGRVLMESAGVEMEELYQKIFFGILDGISTSVYKAFDFELQPPAAAAGAVTITFGGPIVDPFVIPMGTAFSAPDAGLKFLSVADVAVAVGATSVDVTVSCATAGSVGNIGAGAITSTVGYTLPTGSSVASAALSGGTDGQSEAERKARFVEFIQSLSRGPVASLVYAVRQVQVTNSSGMLAEYVTRVGVVEVPGSVQIYVYGSAGAPSATLISTAQVLVDGSFDQASGVYQIGYRAAGVEAVVLPMSERSVPVSLKVKMMQGVAGTDAVKNDIATALASVFDGVASGGVLYVQQIINAALAISGIEEVIADNGTNELCAPNEVLKLGAYDVEWI